VSEQPNEGESIVRRGCFFSGVAAVFAIILLKRFAFRLPFIWVIILAGALWLFFFMVMMRRGK
jgi:hypothetical protein